MKPRTQQISRLGNVGIMALIGSASLLVVAFLASPVSAQSPDSNNCFGGALSSDAIHCEVFEWAHNEEVIEVAAVYGAGRALYIYLKQTGPLDDAALKKMLAKSQEVAQRSGEHDCVLDSLLCGSGVVNYRDKGGYILPKSSMYQTIELFPGGAEARRSSPGWQVFQQFWPQGAGGAAGTTGAIDVSGVDRVNFPTLTGDCNSLVVSSPRLNDSCRMWEKYPALEIASKYKDTWNDKVYIYVKAGIGEEAPKTATAKTVLMNAQPDYYTEDRLVVVAVPHDFEELWRWSLVLDRFAESAGNTLGLTNSRLGFNMLGGLSKDRKYVFPLADAPDLTDNDRDSHGFPDGLRFRLIVQVETLEFERTVAGMPQLLKQLEIPGSAVGLIFEKEHVLAERGYTEPASLSDDLPSSSVALADPGVRLDPDPMSWWTWSVAAASVAAIAGLVGLFAFRRYRLMSDSGRED